MGIKRLIDQWNTKTAGGSSKLSVSDYHLIQDPIHIQDTNIDALELTNTVGQATNTQSQSGPLVGTAHIVQITDIDADQILYQPTEGVWQLMGGDILETNGAATFTIAFDLKDADGKMAFLGTCSTTGQETIAKDLTYSMSAPVYISPEVYLWGDRQAGEGRVTLAFIRVR